MARSACRRSVAGRRACCRLHRRRPRAARRSPHRPPRSHPERAHDGGDQRAHPQRAAPARRRRGVLQEAGRGADARCTSRSWMAREGADGIFALAELSFFHAEARAQGPERGLDPVRSLSRLGGLCLRVSLSGTGAPTSRIRFDPRVRVAADLYNRGLAQDLPPGRREFDLRSARRQLRVPPSAFLDVYFDAASSSAPASAELTEFVPGVGARGQGLPTRYRSPGIGAPLAASTEPVASAKSHDDFVQPWSKVPVTALLRMDDVRAAAPTGPGGGGDTRVPRLRRPRPSTSAGRQVPLETETSAALAYTFARVTVVLATRARRLPQHAGASSRHPGSSLTALSPRAASRSFSSTVPPRAPAAGRR